MANDPAHPAAPLSPEEVARLRNSYAYGLPAGSVRAILALMIFGAIWALILMHPYEEVPSYLRDLMFIIMGHYFAIRRDGPPTVGPPPLYLPRGTIRLILVAGFIAVGTLLVRRHQVTARDEGTLHLNHAAVTLILVAGFMLGVIVAHFSHHTSRLVEDIRATVSLACGIALLLMLFGLVRLPDTPEVRAFQHWILHYRVEDILAAAVGFYFGSKS